MGVIATALRHMIAARLPAEQIIRAVEAMEAAADLAAAGTLTPRQARNRRYYESKGRLNASEKRLNSDDQDASENRLKASNSVLNQTPLTRVENNSPLIELDYLAAADAETRVGVAEPAPGSPGPAGSDWPPGTTGALSALLVAAVNEGRAQPTARLDPIRQPGLTQTLGQIFLWKTGGASWEHDVVPVVTALARKTGPPIKGWNYFADAIAQSMAANRKPFEAQAHENDRPDHRRGTSRNSGAHLGPSDARGSAIAGAQLALDRARAAPNAG